MGQNDEGAFLTQIDQDNLEELSSVSSDMRISTKQFRRFKDNFVKKQQEAEKTVQHHPKQQTQYLHLMNQKVLTAEQKLQVINKAFEIYSENRRKTQLRDELIREMNQQRYKTISFRQQCNMAITRLVRRHQVRLNRQHQQEKVNEYNIQFYKELQPIPETLRAEYNTQFRARKIRQKQ